MSAVSASFVMQFFEFALTALDFIRVENDYYLASVERGEVAHYIDEFVSRKVEVFFRELFQRIPRENDVIAVDEQIFLSVKGFLRRFRRFFRLFGIKIPRFYGVLLLFYVDFAVGSLENRH